MSPRLTRRTSGRTPARPARDSDSAPQAGSPFPVVGIGASAGGLEAFTQLLTHLPATTGMAFVVVQHLDPTHESALVDLLVRSTMMPVAEVTDGVKVEADRVYVIPPNANLTVARGGLIAEVRSLQTRRGGRIPVVAVTAYGGSEERQRLLAAGFQRHVAKPVDAEKLAAVIAELVPRRRS